MRLAFSAMALRLASMFGPIVWRDIDAGIDGRVAEVARTADEPRAADSGAVGAAVVRRAGVRFEVLDDRVRAPIVERCSRSN